MVITPNAPIVSPRLENNLDMALRLELVGAFVQAVWVWPLPLSPPLSRLIRTDWSISTVEKAAGSHVGCKSACSRASGGHSRKEIGQTRKIQDNRKRRGSRTIVLCNRR